MLFTPTHSSWTKTTLFKNLSLDSKTSHLSLVALKDRNQAASLQTVSLENEIIRKAKMSLNHQLLGNQNPENLPCPHQLLSKAFKAQFPKSWAKAF